MELLDKVGLKDKADVYPHTLSGGQQRGGNRQSTCHGTKGTAFCEPTSALDPELVGDVLDGISGISGDSIRSYKFL